MTKTISVELEKLEFVLESIQDIRIHEETPVKYFNKIVEARNWINDRILYARMYENLDSDQEETQQEPEDASTRSIIDPNALSLDVFKSLAFGMGWEPGANDSILPEIQQRISVMSEDEVWEKYCTWNGLLGSLPTQLKDALDSIRNSKK